MTTLAGLIQETKRYLLPTTQEAINTLSGAHTSSTTTITFSQDLTNHLAAGTYIAVDLEIMYVWSVLTGPKTATVQRGMQGSTAATHADAALVTFNPRFPDFSILQAINSDLDDLSSPTNGLYQVPATIEFTYQPQINGYDLTAIGDFINILSVRYDIPGPWKTWPELRHYKVIRNMDTTDFASGSAIVLEDQAYPGRDVRVTYSAPFTHFSTLTDDITTVAGLPASCADIPPLGAAARLAAVRETQRNQFESQSDPRRATEVPPNAQLAGATALQRLRMTRIKAEAARLNNNYPTRRRV